MSNDTYPTHRRPMVFEAELTERDFQAAAETLTASEFMTHAAVLRQVYDRIEATEGMTDEEREQARIDVTRNQMPTRLLSLVKVAGNLTPQMALVPNGGLVTTDPYPPEAIHMLAESMAYGFGADAIGFVVEAAFTTSQEVLDEGGSLAERRAAGDDRIGDMISVLMAGHGKVGVMLTPFSKGPKPEDWMLGDSDWVWVDLLHLRDAHGADLDDPDDPLVRQAMANLETIVAAGSPLAHVLEAASCLSGYRYDRHGEYTGPLNDAEFAAAYPFVALLMATAEHADPGVDDLKFSQNIREEVRRLLETAAPTWTWQDLPVASLIADMSVNSGGSREEMLDSLKAEATKAAGRAGVALEILDLDDESNSEKSAQSKVEAAARSLLSGDRRVRPDDTPTE